MRAIPSIAAVLMVAATLSVATLSGTFAQDATKGALANDPAVKQSQEPEPNAQGIRTPKATTSGETQSSELQQALAAVRAAPPDLQGNKTPRPNWLASEPDQPNEPTRSQNPSDLSSQEVK